MEWLCKVLIVQEYFGLWNALKTGVLVVLLSLVSLSGCYLVDSQG